LDIEMLPEPMFSILNSAASKGLAEEQSPESSSKQRAQGWVRGETYAYWCHRREGYIVIARNFTSPGIKGELDVVAYDGPVLAFVDAKTRAVSEPGQARPGDAIHLEERNLARMGLGNFCTPRLGHTPGRRASSRLKPASGKTSRASP
jgi:hypothetical protein